MPQDPIIVETTVNAPIGRVWQAYTSPADVTQWNFASPDWCCPRAESDLRAGGKFSYRMEARDGSMGFDFAGSFTQVVPQARIAYDFGDRHAVVTFVPRENGVMVRVAFDAEDDAPRAQQREGWQAILDNFARHVHAT